VTWVQIGYIFGLNGGTIFRHVMDDQWSDRPRGRPPSLSALKLVSLRGFLLDQFTYQTAASYADIGDLIFIETGKNIPAETIRHLMTRFPGCKTEVAIGFEAERVKTDPMVIGRHFDPLERILVDFPADIVINLDEPGHCEWIDVQTEIGMRILINSVPS
jgi:hypothetical protein